MEFLINYAPYLLAILAWIPGLISIYKQGKKDKADISSKLVDDALKLKKEVEEQIIDLKAELNENRKELALTRQALDLNRQQLELNKNKLNKNENDIIKIKKTVRCLRKGVDILIEQIETMGAIPNWRPEKEFDLDNSQDE